MTRPRMFSLLTGFTLCSAMIASAGAPVAGEARGGSEQETDRGRIYRLSAGARYASGCFPPCECAFMERSPALGTLILTPAGFGEGIRRFDVTEVNWLMGLGEGALRAVGSGTYQIGGLAVLQHRLELDLIVGDEPVTHFDSEWQVVEDGLPHLDITISINGIYCVDTVFRIQADQS